MMYATIQTTTGAASANVQKLAANQNSLQATPLAFVGPGASPAPQWYDVKLLVERMFDMRTKVRDAIESRKFSEQVTYKNGTSNVRAIRTDGLYGHDMEIAIAWHSYRRATAEYHRAWNAYQDNLKKF